MTNRNEMEIYFTVGFYLVDNPPGTPNPTRVAILDNGFDSMFRVNEINSTEEIHRICETIRKPGGMRPDPANPGQMVPDRGIAVPPHIERYLKQFWFFTRYIYITSRPLNVLSLSLAELNTLQRMSIESTRSSEEDEPMKPGLFEGPNKARGFFESLDNYFADKLGRSGVPLEYVIREQHEVPAADAGLLLPTMKQDLAARGRHDGIFWPSDNKAVWDVMYGCFHDTVWWATIQGYAAARDGHGAYQAAKVAFMGAEIARGFEAKADSIIETINYDGKSKNFSFSKYVNLLTKAFNDQGPDDRMSEYKKVTKFLKGITDPDLKHVKAAVGADTQKRSNFISAVAYFNDQMATMPNKTRGDSRNIASTNTNTNKFKGNRGKKTAPHKGRKPASKFDPKDPGKYLGGKAWFSLSAEQKAASRAARAKAGIVSRVKANDGLTKSIAALETKLEALTVAANNAEVRGIGATMTQRAKRKTVYVKDDNGNFIAQP